LSAFGKFTFISKDYMDMYMMRKKKHVGHMTVTVLEFATLV